MKQALIIEASPRKEDSMSGKVARRFEEKLRREHPEARIVRRNLAEPPMPHLSDAAVHALGAGKTFAYSEKGPVGLAAGKKAVVIVASGGVYGSGPMASFDFVTPYLQRVLNFIGIQDVQLVRVEGTAVPPLAAAALPNAQKAVEALVI
ncbi:MAG TPA: NAD(P)H-dependent oxidoreductase [Elusimicrobiota bacterium]|nr:NAD(P)H-dependent oxidoreductase [Elusimicrobiota bacterium]